MPTILSTHLKGGAERESYPIVVIRYANAHPRVVTRPTCLPPYLKASGIIVSASMVKNAPPGLRSPM